MNKMYKIIETIINEKTHLNIINLLCCLLSVLQNSLTKSISILVKIEITKNFGHKYKFFKPSVPKKILSDILKNNTPMDNKIRVSIKNNKKDSFIEGFSEYSSIFYWPIQKLLSNSIINKNI